MTKLSSDRPQSEAQPDYSTRDPAPFYQKLKTSFLYYHYFWLQLDLCLSGMVCEGKGILPFLAIFFAIAGCKVKLCCDKFHTTFTTVSSGKSVLRQHFHDRSSVYHTVYRIYSRSFVSLRSTDTDFMKFGRKRLVKTSRTWFGRRTKRMVKRKLHLLH